MLRADGRDRLVAGEDGLRQVAWLRDHLDAHPERWDAVARDAVRLLAAGGFTAALAAALFNIGSVVHRRPGRTPEQAHWAVYCLHRSGELWAELGDETGQLAAAEALRLTSSPGH